MQGYQADFARVYNEHWVGFAKQVAPLIHDYFVSQGGDTAAPILDLCCGTGQAAHYFLERGWRVTGLDLSADMLHYAKQNNAAYVESGNAQFVQGDAADFAFDETFGLAISIYDALNHLPDSASLRRCFQCVRRVLKEGGIFIFDLNTRTGIKRWNNMQVTDSESLTLINRGVYDGGDQATMLITGFVRDNDGRYTRFVEAANNTLFALDDVRGWLYEAGFTHVHFARGNALDTEVNEPEMLDRAWVVAR